MTLKVRPRHTKSFCLRRSSHSASQDIICFNAAVWIVYILYAAVGFGSVGLVGMEYCAVCASFSNRPETHTRQFPQPTTFETDKIPDHNAGSRGECVRQTHPTTNQQPGLCASHTKRYHRRRPPRNMRTDRGSRARCCSLYSFAFRKLHPSNNNQPRTNTLPYHIIIIIVRKGPRSLCGSSTERRPFC